jgi:hypothetical protein
MKKKVIILIGAVILIITATTSIYKQHRAKNAAYDIIKNGNTKAVPLDSNPLEDPKF